MLDIEFERIALAVMLALLFVGFTWFCFYRYRQLLAGHGVSAAHDVVIAYASQSGRAHALAEQCWRGFNGTASIASLNQLTLADLRNSRSVIIFASTYGDGEAPDNGALFEKMLQKLHKSGGALTDTQYGVVALGDSYYPDFCQFGHRIQSAMQKLGAKPIVNVVELDASNPEQEHTALLKVGSFLTELGGELNIDSAEHSVIPTKTIATLESRQLLNQNSPGAPLYWLRLTSSEPLVYRAGDILEVFARNSQATCHKLIAQLGLSPQMRLSIDKIEYNLADWLANRRIPLPQRPAGMDLESWLTQLPEVVPRQYTIANASNSESIELVVRQQKNEQGELGLASGWLTESLACGDVLRVAIRDNSEFHTPAENQPLILIGNGSGIAGLRAHAQHRAATGGAACWLLYGERDPVADRPFNDELGHLQNEKVLERVDCVYSRNDEESEYVQDRLAKSERLLKQWLDKNACIYVCGSREGMGQGVHDTLINLLGEAQVEKLQATGRYRRDVY